MTVNLGYSLMHINEVSFMYSWEDPLEKGMATTLVFLPGKSHGQRSLGRLQSIGLPKSQT